MIISNCWRNRTQRFGPLSRFSSALMGESGMGRTKAAGWRKEEEREREMGCTNVSQGSQHLWLNWCKTPEPAQKVFGSSISSTTRASDQSFSVFLHPRIYCPSRNRTLKLNGHSVKDPEYYIRTARKPPPPTPLD